MQHINELAADREHGAAWLTRRAIEILQALKPQDLHAAAIAVAVSQPSMASLLHLANRVLLTGKVPAKSEFDRCVETAVQHALEVVHQQNVVLTHSRSGTVERVLETVRPTVVCTESQPLGEGLALAASLRAHDIAAICVSDMAVESEITRCSMVLVGADAVSPSVVVNKVGTAQLAMLARQPFYVVCTLDKLIPRARAASELFDETPLNLVTAVITESGLMSADKVRAYIEPLQIHPDLRHLL